LENKPDVICKNVIIQKIKSLLGGIDTRKLLNYTRLATGVWPPDDAESNMIRSYIGMMKSVKTIILISKVGFEVDLLECPIQFQVFLKC
jgi:hypothetical protein